MQRGAKKNSCQTNQQPNFDPGIVRDKISSKSIFEDQMMCILTVADLPHVKQQKVLIDWLQQQDRVFRNNEKKNTLWTSVDDFASSPIKITQRLVVNKNY